MSSISVMIESYLTKSVKDNKDTLSRQTRKQAKETVLAANGKLNKFDVLDGIIFIDVDTDEVANAVVQKFNTVSGVKASKIDTFQAIYRKAQARAELDEQKKKAEATAKTEQKVS